MRNSISPAETSARLNAAALAFGFLVTAALLTALLLPRLSAEKSAFPSFCRIRMAMSQGQVEGVLEDQKISCRWKGLASVGAICEFADFWRDYRIVIDRRTDKVVRKTFTFKPFRFVRH
jgi:hypothetical protein